MGTKTFDIEVAPAGTDLTSANTGITGATTNGGTAKSSTTFVVSGSYGARMVCVANQLCIIRMPVNAANVIQSFTWPFMVEATPATNPTVHGTLRYASGVAMRFYWTTANSFVIYDSVSGNPITLATGLTPGGKYWLEGWVNVATSTTGSFELNLYSLATGAMVGSASSSAYNLGTAAIAAADAGITNTNATAGTAVDVDAVTFTDGVKIHQAPPVTVHTGSIAGTASSTGAAVGTPAFQASVTGTASSSGSPAGTPRFAATATGTVTSTGAAAGSTSTTLPISSTTSSTGTATATPTFEAIVAGVTLSAATLEVLAHFDASAVGAATSAGEATASTHHTASIDSYTPTFGHAEPVRPARDITVTVALQPSRWRASLADRNRTATLGPRRWDAHV